MFASSEKKDRFIIILLGSLFFFPFLGGVHLFDWDEINFAECAREMIVTGDYLRVNVDFKPFWEKPPLFFWMQVVSMKLWGINEYAARFPNAICGVVSLLCIYQIGLKLKDRLFGGIWVLAYLGSILPHLYFKSGIIDPWFNLFIFLGLYFLIQFHWSKNLEVEKDRNWKYLILGGVFIGVAILTKGPVGLLIPGLVLTIYWIINRFRFYISISEGILFLIVVFLTAGIWFGLEYWQNGPWFIQEFTSYQVHLLQSHGAGHRGFLGYHFIVLLFGCFPASIFAIRSLYKTEFLTEKKQIDFARWMKILFWVVLILFSIVQSKIVHYSSLCYFPLTFLAACTLHQYLKDQKWENWIKIIFIAISTLIILVFILFPILVHYPDFLASTTNDPFTKANFYAEIEWGILDFLPAICLMIILGGFLFYKRIEFKKMNYLILFLGMGIFIQLTLILWVNKIETFSQRPVIEFYTNLQNEDCYVYPIYRTYAHLFYTKRKGAQRSESYVKDWLMNGEIDKDVYFVSRIHKAQTLKDHPSIKELYTKNGFIFFKRAK